MAVSTTNQWGYKSHRFTCIQRNNHKVELVKGMFHGSMNWHRYARGLLAKKSGIIQFTNLDGPSGGPCDLTIHCSDSGVKHLNAMRTTSLSLQRSGCANDKHRQLERMASQHDIVELYWYINLVGPKQQQNTAFPNDFERAQLLRHLTSLFHHFLSTNIWSISNITSKI